MPLTAKQTSDKHWELMQSKGCKVIAAPAAYNKRLRQERILLKREFNRANDEAIRLKNLIKSTQK